MKVNSLAKIYVSNKIFDEHVKKRPTAGHLDIGVKAPNNRKRFVYLDKNTIIDDEISFFTEVQYETPVIGDEYLYTYTNGRYEQDRFDHELYMVIQEDEKTVLFTGCSHKGINNIMTTIETQNIAKFTHVFGGFHFSHYDQFNIKQGDYLINLSEKWQTRSTEFYTGHCTGKDAFFELKQRLRFQLHQIQTGSDITI